MTYAVTSQMCNGIDNALELINRLPGASYDIASKAFKLNNQANILLLVDGMQYSKEYLTHLSPHRIHAIEVIYALSGRFVSDDYAGIIHYRLKKDYTGYDIHLTAASTFNLSKTADAFQVEKYPGIGFIYTTRKLNFFGTYSYEWERRNTFTSKSLTYYASELVSIPAEKPANLARNENHTVTGGVNYHLTPRQLLGIQADYSAGNNYTFEEYKMNRQDLSNNYNVTLTNTTENRLKANLFAGTVFYQGQITNRLRLSGDFSYNYYSNDF
jgi:hypothetical protein